VLNLLHWSNGKVSCLYVFFGGHTKDGPVGITVNGKNWVMEVPGSNPRASPHYNVFDFFFFKLWWKITVGESWSNVVLL